MEELVVPVLRLEALELLLTEPSADELLLLTEVPELDALLEEERVPETLELLLEEERVLPVVAALLLERVFCWLLLAEVLLVEEDDPEVERVTCWLLLAEVLLVEEEEPEVERLTCWLLELEREAEAELEREAEEPELLRVAWVEDDLEPLVERVWAIISGAETTDRAISTVAAIVIKRLIASNF
ncbi:MAG: hypothetical protein IK052_01330 [Bacteroidales bacterium]|nr:hypothetical protein [Bacteroidales bacterium]